jgi:hypothetical protein
MSSNTSEISKIYTQYHNSLKSSQNEFHEKTKHFAGLLEKRYDELLINHIVQYKEVFEDQIQRIEIKRLVENFFESSRIQFVAIDGSCLKHESPNFVSFYGGAYGSKGTISLSSPRGEIEYTRWELNKDVSMVAFVPIPPEMMSAAIDEEPTQTEEIPEVLTDNEIAEFSSLHTRIMQLAEVYLAYSMACSPTAEAPKLIMMDNTLCGILASTSFRPTNVRLTEGDFNGEQLTMVDMQLALSHPFNNQLGIPTVKNFQPHFRVIAEANWNESRSVSLKDYSDEATKKNLKRGMNYLSEGLKAGIYDKVTDTFTFNTDPRVTWIKVKRIFEHVCEKLFREKDPEGLTYKIKDEKRREFFRPKDIQFLIGVGIRSLIEECWRKRIFLVGVVKDSFSQYYYRNYLGAFCVLNNLNVNNHLKIPLTDRTIVEMLPYIKQSIKSPWSTVEYDSSFMTLHPQYDFNENKWKVNGYAIMGLGETTRPERLFFRSLVQFFMNEEKSLAAHAIFIDRLIYPGWDDHDSKLLTIPTDFFGDINVFFNDNTNSPSRLQKISMFLLTVLVRNHFPEAIGYPDPLHQADWGAKSLKRRVTGLLESSEWAFRANPREKTFREIRDSFKR